jgi:lipopolysaccharide export system protein LptA
MSGSGDGMSYDHGADVLRIDDRAQVNVTGENADSRMHFTAGGMTLDRMQDVLRLERNVHAVRGEQVTDADVATMSLTPEEDTVTFVQLRGNARVQGGAGSLESMRAKDIDLDYTEDGETLERALLMGGGSVVLRGQQESPGREFSAGVLDASLGPDGSVTRLVGDVNVVMTLPASSTAPARSVTSDRLEAWGSEGQSVTSARFSGGVSFRETAASGGTRLARSTLLLLDMSHDTISSAQFTGGVTFQEDDLSAISGEARYDPDGGRLHLGGSEANRLPTVVDDELRVEARTIEIALDTRALDARGQVKTTLTAETATPSDRRGRAKTSEPSRLPGLLARDRAVNVTADRLLHEGEGGMARFSGRAWLWQGDTEIRAETIDIDQKTGDLMAKGGARSVLEFESGRSDGQAYEIRYADATRVIVYASAPAGTQTPDEASPRLRGPQGDLAAERIEIVLASKESRVERIEGYVGVTAQVDGKTITGHRFTYQQMADRYEVSGTPAKPMSVRTESCRENSGSTLTFERSTDTMTIDGRTVRTQTKNTCREPASH